MLCNLVEVCQHIRGFYPHGGCSRIIGTLLLHCMASYPRTLQSSSKCNICNTVSAIHNFIIPNKSHDTLKLCNPHPVLCIIIQKAVILITCRIVRMYVRTYMHTYIHTIDGTVNKNCLFTEIHTLLTTS